MSGKSNATSQSDAMAANQDAADRSLANRERRAWFDLTCGQRRILNGHRDGNATEREAGMIQVASANRKLATMGINVAELGVELS